MSSNLDRNTDPAQLKNQVIHDIKRVKEDLKEIKKSLTPGQIIDQVVFGHQSTSDTLQYLVKNPIGASFLTIGSLLLMRDKQNNSYESLLLTKAKDLKSHADDSIIQTKAKMAQVKAEVQSGLTNKSQNIEEFKGKLSDKVEGIKSRTHQLKEYVEDVDPMVLITIGTGLGVLSGFATPTSDIESRFSDKLSDFGIDRFMTDLQSALNKSINLVKNEIINDVTSNDVNFF